MSVHYKFKSALKYDTITFDGLHISVKDLKRDILQQKQIGKTGDFDLQITNAQTNEVYQDENALIPKNSSLIVVRVPLTVQQKRAWDRQEANQQFAGLKHINTNLPAFPENHDPAVQKLAKAVDLSSLDASEDDKILAMMTQSTLDYDPINYARIRGTSQVGEVPANYRCYKCHQAGHWIKDCRFGANQENQPEIRKSTGIPRSFMVPVDGPSVPGAMMTPSGQFAVPSIDQQAYLEGKKPSLPPEEMAEKPSIPEELVCSICHDLLTDTVMIPCCGSSFCDECIRTVLLESENHQCPDCKEIGISPDTMIPNRYLRKSVDNFRNTTGYQRTLPSRTLMPSHPLPGNSLVQVPMVQPIQALGAPRPLEIINLTETRSDTDSPLRTETLGRGLNNNVPTNSRLLPLHQNPSISTSNSIIPPSKGADTRGPPPLESGRMHYQQPDRSATPTVDERTVTTSLPDTSIPPPVATYAITALGVNPPAAYGPPPGYGAPPPNAYPRAPLPYPNLGPGPGPNYPPVESRGNLRPGYRPYMRGGRHGGRMSSGYRDRDRNSDRSGGHPPGGIDDPLSAFEKILREKDLARERSRRRKRSFTRSPSPRMRSRSRSPPPHRKRGSVSPSPPARQRSPSPPPRSRHSRTPSPLLRNRSPRGKPRTTHSRSKTPRSRTRSRTRSPPPMKRRSPSFTISRSRSRSFSRTPSPRERHFSPRRRDDTRFRSPLQGRNSPQRYTRNYKEYEAQYYDTRTTRGRSRGYGRGRGSEPTYYPTSPARYESRYEDRPRNYQQPSQQIRGDAGSSNQSNRYNNRRYDNYGDTVPPGTEPVGYERYANEYGDRMVVTITSDPRESKREREVREAAARDWERTRDRELEQREKERIREYDDYHRSSTSYRKSSSPDKHRKRSRERGKENKQHSGEVIEAISIRDQNLDSRYNKTTSSDVPSQSRSSVLIELKKEPSVDKEKRREEPTTPKDKEKKKEKEKKKKKKDEGEKKEKKKKRKEKKEGLVKGKSEEKTVPLKATEGKPIVIGLKGESSNIDPLYGDIDGANVDKQVVENYGKVDHKQEGDEVNEITQVAKTIESKESVVLAPVPQLSKWELDEDLPSQEDRLSADDGSCSADKKVVTSEVLKRAENAIFQKAINAIRPIDLKKSVVQDKIPEKVKDKKDVKDVSSKDHTPQEPLKIISETPTESREARKVANSIQITIPSHQTKVPERSVEIAVATSSVESSEPSKSRSRLDKVVSSVPVVVPTSPVRVSAKERLGAKVENDREEIRRVRSTVERKSRSKTPKRFFERKYSDREKPREISPGGRRVVVSSSWSRDREREESRKRGSESNKTLERRVEKSHPKEKDRRRERSSSRERKHKKEIKSEKIIIRKRDDKTEERQVTVKIDQKKEGVDKKIRKNPRLSSDRKKSALDEANFEPDYDGTEPESEPEVPGEEKNLLVNVTLTQPSPLKKRSRSPSEEKDKKKLRSEVDESKLLEKLSKEKESEKLKKLVLETEDSSESDSSTDSSSDSSVERKKHRKKKKSKKRKKKKSKKRKNSSSDSESSESSSSDSDTTKKKKKHKHRKKSSKSKKRKKSKHK